MVATTSKEKTAFYPTRIDLPLDTRQTVVALLNGTLAATTDLRTQTKQAHWNVKGKDFYQLHLLFDEMADELEEYSDMVAERITVSGEVLERRYDYDLASNLTERQDRNGRTQAFTYDKLNRQTQERWLDAQGNTVRDIDYSYDAASQLTSVTDPDSAYSYTYDAAGRLLSTDNSGTAGTPDVLLNYGYDAVNNRTSVADVITGQQAGLETFAYDDLNRVTRIEQSGVGVADKRVELTYNAASQMTGVQRYRDLAGTQTVADSRYDYDTAGRLTALTHEQDGNSIAGYGFTYDAANRLTQ